MFCSLQEELVVSTLCVGEQCAEAEPLKSGSRGGGEAPPSLQVTSSALVFFLTPGLGAAKAERHQNQCPASPCH